MKGIFSIGMAAVFLVQPLLANGGGYFRGGVETVGDVVGFEPKETEKIRILDEKLTVELGAAAADVEVRYLMRNETDKKVKVRFGFPVEESFDRNDFEPSGEGIPVNAKQPKYCQNYSIAASGNPVDSKWQAEPKPSEDKRFKGIAGWLVSEITFAAGEEKPVLIRFRSAYPEESWSVSDDSSTGSSLFKYRLSTAACWAGTIGSGKITLKPNGIPVSELKVLKPVNRFRKDGDNWVWDFENLEPTMADDLEIEASPQILTYEHGTPDGSIYVSRGDKWSICHVNYGIKASSTLPAEGEISYAAENLKSLWSPDTAWCEGAKGAGTGEWIELAPEVPKPLAAIEIAPGYFKSEELFEANARPKKLLVELNGEHSFTATVQDARVTCHIPILGYAKPVKTIRMTFQEVWPGKKYEDLCVSAIRLHVRLDKKPKIQPAR
jgi:hypothetical protein